MTTVRCYDEVLISAQRLPLGDQLRLISALTSAAAGMLGRIPAPDGWSRWEALSTRPVDSVAADDPRTELDALIAEAVDLGPAERDSAEVLREMRC